MAGAALVIAARLRRRQWLDALDRRFFREQYDAKRLLEEVLQDARVAQSLEQVARPLVEKIEAALHPHFAVIWRHDQGEEDFRTVALTPADAVLVSPRPNSKLVTFLRVLDRPIEVPPGENGWLQRQLPPAEREFLLVSRMQLIVPVAFHGGEALLVLGSKRSEEPYTREDQDLLGAIGTSLALLLGRASRDVGEQTLAFSETDALASPEARGNSGFHVAEWFVCPELNTVSRNGITRHLEPKVMEVLVVLAERAPSVVPKDELIDRVWADAVVGDEVLKRSIFELRKVFDDHARESHIVQTIPKRGYRLVALVSHSDPIHWR